MTPGRSLKLNQRIYRSLLLLYPRAFRQVYGHEMVLVFGDRLREERERSGRRASVAIWLRTLLDLFKSAPIQRMERSMSREATFAIAFGVTMVAAAAVFMMGLGGFVINIAVGVLLLTAIGLGASGVLNRKAGKNPSKRAPKLSARDWWVVLAAVIGVLQTVAISAQTVSDPKPSNLAALVVVGGLGLLGPLGAWTRTRSRTVGDWMIVIGILPLAGLWWAVWPTVLALTVITMAIRDTLKSADSEPAAA